MPGTYITPMTWNRRWWIDLSANDSPQWAEAVSYTHLDRDGTGRMHGAAAQGCVCPRPGPADGDTAAGPVAERGPASAAGICVRRRGIHGGAFPCCFPCPWRHPVAGSGARRAAGAGHTGGAAVAVGQHGNAGTQPGAVSCGRHMACAGRAAGRVCGRCGPYGPQAAARIRCHEFGRHAAAHPLRRRPGGR